MKLPGVPNVLSRKRPGSAPGTLVHTGERLVDEVTYDTLHYTTERVERTAPRTAEEAVEALGEDGVTWLNVNGLHEPEVVRTIGEALGLHPLVQEDILNPAQRPKMEAYDDHIYVALRMITWDREEHAVGAEQVSLVLTRQGVVTFQERPGDVFEAVRERINQGRGRIRGLGPDYLAYALIDAVVDHVFVALEGVAAALDLVEERLMVEEDRDIMARLYDLRWELLVVRKAVSPLRDVASNMARDDHALVTEDTQLFLRDVMDHAVQANEAVELYRETVTGLLDLHLSLVSHRMNEVMKVLTIIATIFIPITFIAGVYGMNFENMPELDEPWAYPMVWASFLLVTLGMIVFFRRKGWF